MDNTQILNAIKEYKKIQSKADFARFLGISTQNLSKWYSRNTFNLDVIMSAVPEISTDWLLTGEGSMLRGQNAEREKEGVAIPILPLTAQGGDLVGYSDSATLKDCEFRISPFPQADFGIYVRGDSMAPLYPSGALVFVKRIESAMFIEWGRVFVVDTLNGSIIKRVLPGSTPDKIKCVSLNSDYAPFEVELSDVRGLFISLGRLIAD